MRAVTLIEAEAAYAELPLAPNPVMQEIARDLEQSIEDDLEWDINRCGVILVGYGASAI